MLQKGVSPHPPHRRVLRLLPALHRQAYSTFTGLETQAQSLSPARLNPPITTSQDQRPGRSGASASTGAQRNMRHLAAAGWLRSCSRGEWASLHAQSCTNTKKGKAHRDQRCPASMPTWMHRNAGAAKLGCGLQRHQETCCPQPLSVAGSLL